MPWLPLASVALLLVIAPYVFCGQTNVPAMLSSFSPPLPAVETALWSNAFVITVGNMTQPPDIVTAVLEKAVRDQYTQIGYGVSIVQFEGCVGTSVYNVDGYMPPPALAPGPGPAYVVPAESPAMAEAAELVYANSNGTYVGAPLSMPLSDNGFIDQPNPLSPSTACYRMNSTIYYEPGNSTNLDPSQGTSNELMTAISEQAYTSGVWAQFFLLNITVLPSAAQVVYAGDKLEELTETGYLTTIRITGEGIVPCLPPRHVAFLAAFRTLNIYNTTNMVRCRFSNITQDSNGFNMTYLSIIRPSGQETLPEAIDRVLEEGSLLQTVQEAGLPAANLSLIAIQENNDTTLGNQLSAQIARLPTTSTIGIIMPGSPGGNSMTAAGGQPISIGAIAGIVLGGAAALGLLAIIGAYILRRHLAFQKSDHAAERSKPLGGLPPAPNSSPQGSNPSYGAFPWVKGQSTALRHTVSPSHSRGSSESRIGSLQPSSSWPLYGTTGGSWQLEEGSVEICRRPDGSDWVLGSGSFGVVYKGLRDGVQEVAIKKLTHVDGWQLQQFQKEIDLLRALSYDKNVVQFFGASMQPDNPVLVLEYMGGGDLRKVLDDPKNASKLIWHRKGHQIALDIARGLVFLHKRRIIHADLKSKNILLSSNLGTAKLADVGLSRIMQGSQASSTPGMVGTFSHAAPEMILGYKVNEKVDVWSLGVVLHEIITREPPVRGQLHSIDAPRQCPPEMKELVARCMHRSPNKRPSAKEVYKIIQESADAESGSDDEPTSIAPVQMPAMADRC